LVGPKGGRTNIQSILFDHRHGWTPTTARSWLADHGYKSSNRLMDIPPHGDFIHVRQQDPDQFSSLRTIVFGDGIKARVGIV
jgi:hypothetical protein